VIFAVEQQKGYFQVEDLDKAKYAKSNRTYILLGGNYGTTG
jgi:hypothetical protein